MKISAVKQNVVALLLACLTLILSNSLCAQTLLWSDEFDGNSLDLSKWNIVDKEDWGGSPGCWYKPGNVEVINGVLTLHSKQETYVASNGYTYGWTGAKVECTYHPQYAYMEARVKHSAPDTYIWATWWTIGWANGAGVWPPEFDMCEFAGQWGDWTPSQSSWWWGTGGTPIYDTRLTNMDESQWHTYGAYWSPDNSMMFYVDGVVSATPTTPIEQDLMSMLMMCSSSPDRDLHPDGCALADMQVDYVRVYDVPPTQPAPPAHLASLKPAASSSSINSAETAAKAFDGLPTSRWESTWADPQWIYVDLQAIALVNQVRLNWQYAAGKDYKIQIADYPWGPWTDCVSVTGNWTHDAWLTYNFTARSGRFVRLYCTARTTIWGYSLYEMQVYGTVTNPNPPAIPTRPNLALNRAATASSEQVADGNGTYVAGNTTDGNNATRWASDWSDPQWIYVDLGSPQTISEVDIYWEAAAASSYQVQTADASGGPWTNRAVITGGSGGWRIVDISPTVSARFVRVYGTVRNSGYGYSIYEIQVYAPFSGPTVFITAPANSATFSPGSDITINADAADNDANIVQVEFFAGTTSLGTDTTSPYSVTWHNVPAGAYSLTARATDDNDANRLSSPVVIYLGPEDLNGDGTVDTADLVILADNWLRNDCDIENSNCSGADYQPDGSVDMEDFYQFSLFWLSNANNPPTVSITSPIDGAIFTAPAGVTINVTASDSDGTISRVDFYRGTTLIGTDTSAPYSCSWASVEGSYSLTAVATDNSGAVTTSAAVGITVNPAPNVPPTVSITLPTNGDIFAAPANITINATAADSDGTVTQVEFYQGTTLLYTDTSAPYSYTWTGVPVGSYSLTAKATDNEGAVTTSTAVGVTSVNIGANIALGKTAIASSGTAANAVDGSMGTRWESLSADPQWIYVDLGGTASITQVQLEWEAAYAKSYQIQTSPDASTWTTVYTTTTGNGGNDTINLSASARYVRMYGTVRATGYGYSLWEFKVYGSGVPAMLSAGKTATASSVSGTNTAAKAVDGSMGTRWESLSVDPQWIYVDLGDTYTISQVILEWEAAYAKSYQIQTSPDAITWTDIYSTTTGDGGNDTLAVSGSGRYVRVNCTVRATGWGDSLWEFKVYGN